MFDDIDAALEQMSDIKSWDDNTFKKVSVSIEKKQVFFKGE
jgi:hypothetical protein